jgi:hypothetical protein
LAVIRYFTANSYGAWLDGCVSWSARLIIQRAAGEGFPACRDSDEGIEP